MKINTRTFYFKDLAVGELFMWDDELYLKTAFFRIDEKQIRNAVCLADNYITNFDDDEPVTPKSGELTIY